ncbi:MAG: type II secretion system major pseudopilin GspG [Planctomycetes bacterium]|nr:type II secretion system major pseudopilin GspG [Planctomycetota bacterium]
MKGQRKVSHNRRRAFTLMEVLMVIVIIGILAAFVVPNFFNVGEDAKKKMTQALLDSGVNGTLDMYKLHIGHYPTEEEGGLLALVEPPEDEELAEKWAGPYLKDGAKLKDAWGNELIYVSPGEYNEETYDLSSPGANGVEGDDDDVANWDRT